MTDRNEMLEPVWDERGHYTALGWEFILVLFWLVGGLGTLWAPLKAAIQRGPAAVLALLPTAAGGGLTYGDEAFFGILLPALLMFGVLRSFVRGQGGDPKAPSVRCQRAKLLWWLSGSAVTIGAILGFHAVGLLVVVFGWMPLTAWVWNPE